MGRYAAKNMYHATKPAVMVYSDQEQAALGPEWSTKYIHQEYPKWKYHWTGKTITVQNSDEEANLGGGWANSPAAFDAYKGPKQRPTEQSDPVKWVEEWSVPGLTSVLRKKIRAQLLKAHAAFWRTPDAPNADVHSMRQAFDGIARVLFEAGILTEKLLETEIPLLVWDSAIAGEWWRLASETHQEIFREQLGHYWVYRDDSTAWNSLFGVETAEWQASLLEAGAAATADSDKPDRPAVLKLSEAVRASEQTDRTTTAAFSTQKPTSVVPDERREPEPEDLQAPSAREIEAPEDLTSEVSRRRQLLAEYKSSTGNPANKRIYEARNSGIHKPQFYSWRNGSLATDSETSLNFERFLREKKSPLSRKPRD
jgi:hypothetical protein